MKTTEFLNLRMLTHFIKTGTFILFLFSFMFQSCQKDIIDTYSESESSQENALKSATISGESINALILKIQDLSDEGGLNTGLANALIKKLESALVNLEKGKDKVAANLLNAVLNQLESLVSEEVIDSEIGSDLIEDTHKAMGDWGAGLPFTDPRDGTVYQTIIIGDQCWMAENLAYLPEVSPSLNGSLTESYYYVYGYDGTDVSAAKATVNYETYGVLYNWTAALESCPEGWHLPSDTEWTILSDFLIENEYGYEGSGSDIAKSLAARINWSSSSVFGSPGYMPNENNSSGFLGLPGGARFLSDYFSLIGTHGYWWSSTEHLTSGEWWFRSLGYNQPCIIQGYSVKENGFSVRCIKD